MFRSDEIEGFDDLTGMSEQVPQEYDLHSLGTDILQAACSDLAWLIDNYEVVDLTDPTVSSYLYDKYLSAVQSAGWIMDKEWEPGDGVTFPEACEMSGANPDIVRSGIYVHLEIDEFLLSQLADVINRYRFS